MREGRNGTYDDCAPGRDVVRVLAVEYYTPCIVRPFYAIEGRARLTNNELVKQRTAVGSVGRSGGDPARREAFRLTRFEVDSGTTSNGRQSGEDEGRLEEHSGWLKVLRLFKFGFP